MSFIAAVTVKGDAILREPGPVLGEDSFDVADLVWTIAARVS